MSAAFKEQAGAGAAPELKIYGLKRTRTVAGHDCWMVSVLRRGRLFQRTFSDQRFGGMEAAKSAALAYRDEIVRTHTYVSEREFRAIRRSNNQSGIPGVVRHQAGRALSWKATFQHSDGRQESKSFSVKTYGEALAFSLAVEARREMLERMDAPAPGSPAQDVTALVLAPAREQFQPLRVSLSPGPGVYRVLQKNRDRHGLLVTVEKWLAEYKSPDQRRKHKSFSIAQYGEEEAMRMAIAQQAAWQQVPPPLAPRQRARNSPVSNVQRLIQHGKTRQGALTQNPLWEVRYTWPDGRRQRKTFSEKRYGEASARHMAEQQRARWLLGPPTPGEEPPRVRPVAALRVPLPTLHRFLRKRQTAGGLVLTPVWQVSYRWPGGAKSTLSFSSLLHGEEEAHQRALEQLEAWRRTPPQRDRGAGSEQDRADR
jgi:hypothetical protein